jgi:alkanesulfonate monooxygenase SsuD/methylene tetrahydromethanopterin reductase-like flavin-dependent oxidoreductase (luciferase family)
MKIGLGLPIADPDVLLTWARCADVSDFSTLGMLDRLVYRNPDPLIILAGLAAATARIRLQTEVLIAPLRQTAILAKACATLDRLAGGRFTLGVGTGGRPDDYVAAGVDIRQRGRRLDEQMARLRQIWAGESYAEGTGPIGPAPLRARGPEVVFGGFAPAAIERVARWGDGFLAAAHNEPSVDTLFRDVERSWQQAGREGRPRLIAQVNAVLGPDLTLDQARTRISDYYAFLGDTSGVVDSMLATPAAIRRAVTTFSDLGADEVIFYCWSPDPEQIERIAETVF